MVADRREQFPPGFADAVRPVLRSLAAEVIAAIAAEVPAYARPLEGRFGRGVTRGVVEGLARFLDAIESVGADADLREAVDSHRVGPGAGREVYVALGRGEVREQRPLDALLAAYRVGARVAWRRLADVAVRSCGMGTDGLAVLAETIFAYIDQISAASAEGYALEQSESAGERERRRDRLAAELLAGADTTTLRAAAQDAGWTPPALLTVLRVPAVHSAAVRLRSGPEALRTVRGEVAWVLVPDAAPTLPCALGGLGVTVGPAVPWTQAARSAARADLARTASDAGRLRGAGDPVVADEHLGALVLALDPALVAELAARRLAPLASLPVAARDRLAATLLQWIALRGERAKVAAALHVHPQTVRYRLGQLRELFGDVLDDADARFELELVLRAGHPQPRKPPART